MSHFAARLKELTSGGSGACFRCGCNCSSVAHRRITFPAAKKRYKGQDGRFRTHYYENLDSITILRVVACWKCYMKIKTHADNALRAVDTMKLLNDLWREIREQIRNSNNGAIARISGDGDSWSKERRPFRRQGLPNSQASRAHK